MIYHAIRFNFFFNFKACIKIIKKQGGLNLCSGNLLLFQDLLILFSACGLCDALE